MSYKPTDKIFGNSWDAKDPEHLGFGAIAPDPTMAEQYDETLTNDIIELYTNRITDDLMHNLYMTSPFYEKYEKNFKKIEKCDIYNIYEYFRNALRQSNSNLNIIQIFISIAEFFELNYDKLYNDIIPVKDKSLMLQTLGDVYGHRSKMNCVKLF